MGVIEKDESSSENASGQAVARLPHDQIGDGNGKGAENGRHSSVSDVGDLVGNIGVANVLEVKVAIVADQPAHEGEQELAKGRVDIEEVGSLEVVRSELVANMSVRCVEDSRMFELEASTDQHTFPKCTSSKTTSLGWLMPQKRVRNASAVMTASAIL